MESFFTWKTIPRFHGAHRACPTANWEPLQFSIPFMCLLFGIICLEKKMVLTFLIYPMHLENVNTDTFIL